MKITVAVFKSRTEVYSFIDILRQYNISASIISTPKEARIGCGISAKFPSAYLSIVSKIAYSGKFSSFHGFFTIEKYGDRVTTTRY